MIDHPSYATGRGAQPIDANVAVIDGDYVALAGAVGIRPAGLEFPAYDPTADLIIVPDLSAAEVAVDLGLTLVDIGSRRGHRYVLGAPKTPEVSPDIQAL